MQSAHVPATDTLGSRLQSRRFPPNPTFLRNAHCIADHCQRELPRKNSFSGREYVLENSSLVGNNEQEAGMETGLQS